MKRYERRAASPCRANSEQERAQRRIKPRDYPHDRGGTKAPQTRRKRPGRAALVEPRTTAKKRTRNAQRREAEFPKNLYTPCEASAICRQRYGRWNTDPGRERAANLEARRGIRQRTAAASPGDSFGVRVRAIRRGLRGGWWKAGKWSRRTNALSNVQLSAFSTK